MDTTTALDNELAKDGALIFMCGKIELPGYTLCLLEASGEVTWGGDTYVGTDPNFGAIGGIEALNDGMGDQAPQLSLTILPPSGAAPAILSNPAMQGSRIRIWLGAIDQATKYVIADPYLLFDGELDQPILSAEQGKLELEYECVSGFEKLFMDDEGLRLSNAHHTEVWPGETGLQDVTGIVKQIIWGPGEKIAPSFSAATPGGADFSGYGGLIGAVFGGGKFNNVQEY